jgi:hypothetical protein
METRIEKIGKIEKIEQMKKFGSKAEVWEGTAQMTRGKLTKEDLFMDDQSKIKSKKQNKSEMAYEAKGGILLNSLDIEEPNEVSEEEEEVIKKYAIPLDNMTVDELKATIKALSKTTVRGLYKLKKQELIAMLTEMGYQS